MVKTISKGEFFNFEDLENSILGDLCITPQKKLLKFSITSPLGNISYFINNLKFDKKTPYTLNITVQNQKDFVKVFEQFQEILDQCVKEYNIIDYK